MRLLRAMMWIFARFVLWLRYRIRVHGAERLKDLEGPVLILPNHPAFLDPPIVLMTVYRLFRPRPLLLEGNFKNPALYPLMTLLDAIRVPDLDQASAEASRRTADAIENVKAALRQKQNVLMWPSGHLQRTGVERLGAARTLSEVLKDVPEAKVLLIRTTGLWGSRFSYGFTGARPPLGLRLLQGAGLLLANLIFLAPRRRVDLTLEVMERSRLPGLEREQLNPFLEAWYNQADAAKPVFVPAHFLFGPRTREFPEIRGNEDVDLGAVKEETRRAVDELLGDRLDRNFAAGELAPQTRLDQLGIDSIDGMELSLAVERRFGFSGDQVPGTVGQLYALASGLSKRQPPKPPPPAWFAARSDALLQIHGDTVAEAFVQRALAHRKDLISADDRSGALSYEKLLVGALCMRRRFAALAGPNVGVLLPASVACDITLLALLLAGKLPVLLNWTTGPKYLAHAADVMGLKQVISSKLFVDRVGVTVDGTSYLHLEDVRATIGRFEQLRTLLQVRWLPDDVRSLVPKVSPDQPAVVLFTSGSEKAPKAVPLSHRNLLTNQRAGTTVLKPREDDIILGFLPAFHSFGMSITGLYPLLTGMKVVRHPDPTDAAALARKIGVYRPTILVGTPTFVSYILERADPGELRSLRMVVVGAEKCPQSVFDRFAEASPGAVVLEGYGITECSPVVSVNPPEANRPGTVGPPLPGVELRVVRFAEGDAGIEIGEPVPDGEMGMLLVSGPTVFAGYLGEGNPDPFRDIDGKRWYVTGDLVEMDGGYIRLRGRLKRFIKVGGEMVSLDALEGPFAQRYPPQKEKDGPRAAVEGVEVEGGRGRIVLFTTEPVSLREANEVLNQAGFHGVMRLDEVRRVEAVPVLGTGKTDYKVLRAQLLEGGAAG